MKNELEEEIFKETIEQININSKSTNIVAEDFNLFFPDFLGKNVNKKVKSGEKIVFNISPANSFKAKGSIRDSFKAKTYGKDLTLFKPNIRSLIDITHGHEGEEFILVRLKLENELRYQLSLQKYKYDVR